MINADPSNYLSKLGQLRAGDTLLLAPGRYGVDDSGNDTASPPGMPLFNLTGRADAPITITGPSSGARPVLLGRNTHNTIRISNASHIVIRRLEVDGRGLAGFGVAVQGPTHSITIEDCHFHGLDGDQQIVAISTTGQPTWNWVIRGNLIEGAGTGMYLGNSNGDSPFVAGLIEYNVIRDTIGYNIQVKHQTPWASVPTGMPTGKSTTIIRHNVFAKSSSSSTGGNARPNLLVGDSPPSGPGSTNDFAIYGNLFYNNPTEALFQAEGNVAVYSNLMVGGGTAVAVQQHNGQVREVRIVGNTIVTSGRGISVSGGAPGYTQRVVGNAVFAASTPIAVTGGGASAIGNLTDTASNSPSFLNTPLTAIPGLDLYPLPGTLRGTAWDASLLAGFPDGAIDFNGRTRDTSYRGAYSGEGTNPGWAPALDRMP